MEEKTKLIEDVIEDFFDEIDQRGYGQNTTWCYKKICRSILAWCCENEIAEFNESAANRYCDENINGHICNPSESLHYKKTLRVARMLVCLNKGEDFEFRAPRIEYEFKTSIKEHRLPYFSIHLRIFVPLICMLPIVCQLKWLNILNKVPASLRIICFQLHVHLKT